MEVIDIRQELFHPGIKLGMDKDERFVMSKCALYLQRLFRHFSFLDRETFELVVWVLGPDARKLCDHVSASVRIEDDEDLEEDLLDEVEDADEYPSRLARALRRCSKVEQAKTRHRMLELLSKRQRRLVCRGKSPMERSLGLLAEMFRLTEHEVELCIFLFLTTAWEPPEDYFTDHLACRTFRGRKYLSTLLSVSHREMDRICHGTLEKIGLIEWSAGDLSLGDDFHLFMQKPSRSALQKDLFREIRPSALPLEVHAVPWEQTDYALKLLRAKPITSTHILLYGPPGTGKSTYAQGLARDSALPVYEISREDEENKSSNRRAAILACLNMTSDGDGAVIIVDEADNLLNTQFSWFLLGETHDKGWLNQLLERSGARMIWIANWIEGVDESVLRRFALSIRFRRFSRKQMEASWETVLRRKKTRGIIDREGIQALAARYPLSPAAVELAVRKALESGCSNKDEFHKALVLSLEAHQTLLNGGEKLRRTDMIEGRYSPEGLNVEGDLPGMLAQLDEFDRHLRSSNDDVSVNMNLLFHGPPGAGKSELARYIAHRLNRELLCKRASELLSKWVGGTEQRIAEAFSEAEGREAVFVVDEADTFLRSREGAHHSWEVSQVNEFLTQMERYRGILICTTNRLMDLDEASVRRFNHKAGFGYLKPEGNVVLYHRLLAPLIPSSLEDPIRVQLMALTDLTPGDFRVVRDRFSFLPPGDVTHERMVEALRQEIAIKRLQRGQKNLGF